MAVPFTWHDRLGYSNNSTYAIGLFHSFDMIGWAIQIILHVSHWTIPLMTQGIEFKWNSLGRAGKLHSSSQVKESSFYIACRERNTSIDECFLADQYQHYILNCLAMLFTLVRIVSRIELGFGQVLTRIKQINYCCIVTEHSSANPKALEFYFRDRVRMVSLVHTVPTGEGKLHAPGSTRSWMISSVKLLFLKIRHYFIWSERVPFCYFHNAIF